ncbi:unnamed protein product (mitochondrion) [Plasmodiophora brassicae]|uniref:PX domain-containing protein n=2 Tax=Plasmodiophora brassicae TaxID=37360 RepID=A0A3P3YG29_PLABS|nr:unnamed protein product [Plasmodiophora brassicae]
MGADSLGCRVGASLSLCGGGSSDGLLTPCWRALLVESIPVAVLLASVPALHRTVRSRAPLVLGHVSRRYQLRLASCLVLALTPVFDLGVRVGGSAGLDAADLIAAACQLLAWAYTALVVARLHRRGLMPTRGLRLAWAAALPVAVVDLWASASASAAAIALSSIRVAFVLVLAADALPRRVNPWTWRSATTRGPGALLDALLLLPAPRDDDGDQQQRSASSLDLWAQWLGATPPFGSTLTDRRQVVTSMNVVSWTEGTDGHGDPFVQVAIDVDTADAGQWTVSHRLRDLAWIGPALRAAYARAGRPYDLGDLPTWTAASDARPAAAQVAVVLQAMLQAAVQCPAMFADMERVARCNEHRRPIVGGPVPAPAPPAPADADPQDRSASPTTIVVDVVPDPSRVMFDGRRHLHDDVRRYRADEARLRIISADVVRFHVDQGLSTATYDINVRSVSGRWSVSRRYRQFHDLQAALTALFDPRLLPSLPPRTFLGHVHDADFLEHRRRHLDMYLQMLANTDYFECRPLHDFLQPCDGHVGAALAGSPAGAPVDDQTALHRFEVTLLHWQYSEASDPKSEVVYQFEICEYFTPAQYLKWVLPATMYDFKQFHACLRRRFPSDVLPDLPAWSLTQSTAQAAFADARATQLEAFLQKVINCGPLACPDLHSFIQLDNANRHISTGMNISALP